MAFQQADYVAWNVWAAINRRPLLPFKYQHLGEAMSLGGSLLYHHSIAPAIHCAGHFKICILTSGSVAQEWMESIEQTLPALC